MLASSFCDRISYASLTSSRWVSQKSCLFCGGSLLDFIVNMAIAFSLLKLFTTVMMHVFAGRLWHCCKMLAGAQEEGFLTEFTQWLR